jgi:succinate dehydrogenase / fumarate reductase cytochrome b subunit
VAATGLVLVGFLIGHVTGNLLYFAGKDQLNQYAEFLHHSPKLLWGTRVVLLLSVILHIVATLQLARLRGDARPIGYQGGKSAVANYAARTMILTGPLIAFFVVYHLLHFTTGTVHPSGFDAADVYNNVTISFKHLGIAALYVAAMLILSGHLVHGIWSMFQTIGVSHSKYDVLIRRVSLLLAFVIVVGFISIPLYVFFHGA